MSDRIKLTEDLIFSTVRRLDYGEFARDTTEQDADIIQQILQNQKKLEKIEELIKERNDFFDDSYDWNFEKVETWDDLKEILSTNINAQEVPKE